MVQEALFQGVPGLAGQAEKVALAAQVWSRGGVLWQEALAVGHEPLQQGRVLVLLCSTGSRGNRPSCPDTPGMPGAHRCGPSPASVPLSWASLPHIPSLMFRQLAEIGEGFSFLAVLSGFRPLP